MILRYILHSWLITFHHNYLEKPFTPLAQGNTRFNLQKSDFMQKKFSFPMIEKQRKIYSILNTYSDKLIVEKQIIGLLCSQKRYLLRQLFI